MTTPLDALTTTPDLWETLAAEKPDILLYGMGNGGDKILRVLKNRGLTPVGVFASDGFCRGQFFHGFAVTDYAAVCEKHDPRRTVVLVAFGTARPEVIDNIRRVAARYPTYAPDVPVCGETLFDRAFVSAHREELQAARALFADEPSRRIFDTVAAYKCSGRLDILLSATRNEQETARLLRLDTVRRAADFGAYTGDTLRELAAVAPLAWALAAEPDPRSFKKLQTWAKTAPFAVKPLAAAVSDRNGTATFFAAGNRSAGLAAAGNATATAVTTVTADEALAGETVDYMKYDVEGAEAAALAGSAAAIVRCRPRLRVACYHRSEDLFALPLLLAKLTQGYRFYLTRRPSLPAWDLDILAVPAEL